MTNIIAHRGLWNGDKSKQNTIESIEEAFKNGFGVEIDLRLNENGDIVLGHDEPGKDLLFNIAYIFYKNEKIIFHIKSKGIAKKLSDFLSNRNIIFSIVGWQDFGNEETEKYKNFFEEERLLKEYDQQHLGIGSPKYSSMWIAENGGIRFHKDDLISLKNRGNHLYYVTPECYSRDIDHFTERLPWIDGGLFNYICTDVPFIFKKLLEK